MRRPVVHIVLRRQQSLAMAAEQGAAVIDGCDRPMVEALEHFPEVPCALHLPGHALEWLDNGDSGLIDRLAGLVSDNRLELIGGGFYAPALPILPWRDAIGQLDMMSGYLERRTGRKPRGIWLEGCLWTPRLAEVLADGGARYTFLEEHQVRSAGLRPGPMAACYATEHVGRPLAILPIHAHLSELALGPPARLMTALRSIFDAGGAAVTLLIDVGAIAANGVGEHIATMLQAFAEADEWVKVQLPAATVGMAAHRPRIYVPDSTSRAAGEGLWQRWLAADGQADRMHKRMIEVSRRFAALERVIRNRGWRAMSKMIRPRRALYRGQNANAYVGGPSGGLNQPQLRDLIYRNLIDAEATADQMVRGDGQYLEVSLRDLYAGLDTEILLRNQSLRAVFRPARGGCLTEFEHLPSRTALLNVLSRRPAGPVGVLPAGDPFHDRGAFHDRFLAPTTGSAEWLDGVGERGDLLAARHRLVALDSEGRGAEEHARIGLAAEGSIRCGDTAFGASLIKEIAIAAPDRGVAVHLSLHLTAPLPEALDWCVEFNLNPVADGTSGELRLHDDDSVGRSLHRPGQHASAVGFSIVAPAHALTLDVRSDRQVGVQWAPLLVAPTGTRSPARWQGVAVLLRRALEPGKQRFEWTLLLECLASCAARSTEECGSG